jgi:hypothetical protein
MFPFFFWPQVGVGYVGICYNHTTPQPYDKSSVIWASRHSMRIHVLILPHQVQAGRACFPIPDSMTPPCAPVSLI